MSQKIVIDATNAALGRLASYSAKQALFGKTIDIVNCNKAIITGSRESILEEYQQARNRGGSSLNGPHFPKSPERILKRTIRGMLPYKQERGLLAFKRIKCYNDVPDSLKDAKKILAGKPKNTNVVLLKEVSDNI